MSGPRTVRLRICGRVQGVWFRANAQERARELGLEGWVRNCEDGSVESVARGDDEAIEDYIEWCRRGPAAARVDRVEVEPADERVGDDFEIRR